MFIAGVKKIMWPFGQKQKVPSLKIPERVPPPFYYVESQKDFLIAARKETSGVIWTKNHHLTLDGFLDNKNADEMSALTVTFADVNVTREDGIIKDINIAEPDDVSPQNRKLDNLKSTPIWDSLVFVARMHAEVSQKDKFFLKAINPSNIAWHKHFTPTTTCAFTGAGSDLRRNKEGEVNTNTGDIVHIPTGVVHRSPPGEFLQSARYIITCGG